MRYLRLSCPGCDTPSAYALDDVATFIECPVCGQKNPTTQASVHLTGRHENGCKYPLDDHVFYGDFIDRCPTKSVKP